jgi:glucose/arabinose dehydrogenase
MRRIGSMLLVISLVALGAACANRSASSGTTAAPAQQSAPAQKSAPPKPVKGAPAPAGSKLAKVEKNMSPDQVRQIMGAPNGEKVYVTGKQFIPYYYGADAGTNTEWSYKGVGRVVFGVNRYTNTTRVIRIDYDPSETGD